MNATISEGTASAVRILRMRGLVHLGTALEPIPFRRLPPPIWKREPTAETGHEHKSSSTSRPA